MRTGVTELPLHGGKCPRWLFDRMVKLLRAMIEVMAREFKPIDFLSRLADSYWFQALGCVLGFDWHSSGLTTTVCGALKESLKEIAGEIGIYVAGGKGKAALKTPVEIGELVERYALTVSPASLVYASRMVAKVDSSAVQDGYQIYHHTFIFTAEGHWAVIQQGLNEDTGWARRYHWLSCELRDFVCEPHKAVCCDQRGETLNLVARESDRARRVITQLACTSPAEVMRDLKLLQEKSVYRLPARHRVALSDLNPRRIERILLTTYEHQPTNFELLLGMSGVGAKTLRALSLVSELIYGAPPSYRDPARFSFAHGGKDGHPYPVDRKVYEQTISFLNRAIAESRLGREDKLAAFRRLGQIEQRLLSG